MELWIMCFESNIWVERNCYCYFCCPFFNGVWWFIVVLIYYRPSSEADDFMRIEDISYIIIWFHIANDEGILEPRWTTFIGIANLWFMVTSSLVCVIFFGIKCYTKIIKALKNSKMSSYYARSIQKQLFQALVLQTLVPVVLMYGPVGILYMFPMLNIEVGFISTFVTATVEVYPAVDPLPTMFTVENFRKNYIMRLQEPKKDGRSVGVAESEKNCFVATRIFLMIPTVSRRKI
ncbi:Protein CBG06395 [Caenorhabditis briggsae]|uniref:Protein CBG06395 n=1 Tax=Caenorhabditis briggsae TaxID=6238 RepID=A8X248_CAEBR|nr:Protein CBG06395 [Caenorhabditis briggsae]CAP26708.2 Protein CBG06395 [Caenorhabditis briggsae]